MTAHPTENLLDRIAQRAGKLYSLPAVAVDVLRLTECPKVDVSALKQCLENDPALTTKILRVVNSSIFGLSCRVSDLGQALALLGTKPLKLLVLGFSLPMSVPTGHRANCTLDRVLNRYWRTTLIKAVAARKLAVSIFEQDGDEPFLVSLLEDLGMLVMIEQLGDAYADFLNKVWHAGGNVAQLERESLGFDHRQLTARLLSVWGLPESLVQAVAARDSETTESPEISRLAELFAELLIDGRPEQLEALRRATEPIDALKSEGLTNFVDGLEQQVTEMAKVLSLDTSVEPDYAHIVAQAHEQLAAVASDTVVDMLDKSTSDCPVQHLMQQVQDLTEAVAAYTSGRCVANARPAPATPTSAAKIEHIETSDPALEGHVQAAVNASRRSRQPLSLLIVEMNQPVESILVGGAEDSRGDTNTLRAVCGRLEHAGSRVVATRDTGFSVVLPDCDRPQAKEFFRQLAANSDGLLGSEAIVCAGVASVALPPKNFTAAKLIDAAARCLRAACQSGSSQLKTIEIN